MFISNKKIEKYKHPTQFYDQNNKYQWFLIFIILISDQTIRL